MVLSNKKLKQKLRAELLAKRVAEPETDKKNPESNSDPQSLKSLLGSVTQKPRLSKREIRRKNVPFSIGSIQETDEKGEEIEKKKPTKRKREEEKVKEGETTSDNKESNNNNKKKKKKKKTINKKKKKQKNVSEEQVVLQVENGTKSQASEDVATKVYVGGIPYRYTEEDIRYYFESVGTITDVDCMKFPDTGKFRGIAIISFETEAAAKEALVLDRAEMGGMQLTIQPYKSTRPNKPTGFTPKMVEGYNRIYVGNLSWDITEDDLKKFFSDCNVSSIRFGTNKETGEFRGYAHVDFSDSVSVVMALKLDQEILCGRPVKISCAVPKSGPKTQSRSHPTGNEVSTSDERDSSKEVNVSVEAPTVIEAPKVNGVDNGGSSIGSGKLRRRTCYVCGEKGHLSSSCPKGPVSVEEPTVNEVDNAGSTGIEAPTVNGVDNGGSIASSGKLRRRTCYVCGEKGHISSACPKGPMSVETPVSIEAPLVDEVDNGGLTGNQAPTVNEIDNGGTSASSGKLRRRTCYECGQKGHISSACPNKKSEETTNGNTN